MRKMKNTCVVEINTEADDVKFCPDNHGGAAYLSSWPGPLRKKFRSDGVYAIRRVKSSTPKAVRVVIVGQLSASLEGLPARFADKGYSICSRFLRELGVAHPPVGKRKTLHLIVRKK